MTNLKAGLPQCNPCQLSDQQNSIYICFVSACKDYENSWAKRPRNYWSGLHCFKPAQLKVSIAEGTIKKNIAKMTFVEFPVIRTERLLLRQFVETDLENVFKGLSAPEIIRYYGVSYKTLEDTKAQMQFFADLEKDGTGIWWAVCSLDNKTFYGAGGLNSLSKEHKKAEIGFWLLTEFWGRGIMTEVMPIICKYGFNNLGLHRIEGLVETENLNCKKAMKKLDFTHEGTMTDCEVKNGKFISLDIYARLSSK